MGFLSKIFGSNPIKEIGDIADRFITTKEEKEEFKRLLIEKENEFELKSQDIYTRRQELDMKSDSRLSKNIRPLSLIFLMLMVTIFAFTDGNVGEFSVREEYINLYNSLLLSAFGFYFVLRGVEKIQKIRNGRS